MSIVDEILTYLDTQSIESTMFSPIGDVSEKDKQRIEQWIRYAIESNPSHLLTGIFTLANISSHPHNFYLIIGSFDGGILLNVNPEQSMLFAIAHHAIF